jgi:hypothetical protein
MIRLEAKRLFNWDISIRTINEYPDDQLTLLSVLNEVARKLKPKARALFLISVNSSGRLIRRILRERPQNPVIVVVCNTGIPVPKCTNLSNLPIDRWKVQHNDECSHCKESTLITIDSRTYERLPKIKWERIAIDRRKAAQHKEFWQAVDESNAVRIHVDEEYPEADKGRTRHHGVYIDLTLLAGQQSFRTKALSTLKQMPRPKLVVIPQHKATDVVRNLIQEAYPSAIIVIVSGRRFDKRAKQKLRLLKNNDCLLIADDALVQGATILGLRDEIYDVMQTCNTTIKVSGFVMLARTKNQDCYREVTEQFRDHDGVQFWVGYKIFLPEGECPWCEEYRILAGLLPSLRGRAKEHAISRKELLSGRLSTSFLLGSKPIGTERKTYGSFFGELKPVAAFAAATAAAQELKASLKNDAGSSKINVADIPKAITRYFDSVFLAAMLRTFYRRELEFGGQDNLVAPAIERKLSRRTNIVTAAEIGWAAVTRKLPSEPALRLLNKTEQRPVIIMLKQMIHSIFPM